MMPKPLTPQAYAPYGDVLSADFSPHAGKANRDSAELFQHLTTIQNLRPHARPNWKIYRCTPVLETAVSVVELEKHPYSTQLFAPMQDGRYLIVVAAAKANDDKTPDLTTLRAFIATSPQAITYHPNIWHLPMTVLDHKTDMLSLVYEDGSPEDCIIYPLDTLIKIAAK